jgi:hypothetical protein
MLVRSGVLCGLVVLASGCDAPRGQQLCDAIARRDVSTVQRLLSGPPINPLKAHGACVPAAAVFGAAKANDSAMVAIGIELLKAGLPADASWVSPGHPEPVWAIEAAAANGNAELVRALVAVGLDVKGPEVTRALVLAAGAGHLRVVKLLVQEGADLEATFGGETPLYRALANEQDEVVQFLEETAAVQALAAAHVPAAARP